MKAFALLVALACVLFAGNALAYGPIGHQIVGGIADQRLADTPTGRKIAEMLDGFTLQKAAVVPDEIKGWDRNGPDDPGIFHYTARPRIDAQLRAFWHANPPTKDLHSPVPSHHWFHYTDVPVFDAEKYSGGKAGRSQWDIVHMMRYCIEVLLGEKSDDNERKITKAVAVILLAHYAGDIHQPLHVGAEWFDRSGKPVDADKSSDAIEDQGGNTMTLQLPGSHKKLHGYWDNDAVLAILPQQGAMLDKEARRAANDSAMDALIREFAGQEPKDWRSPKKEKVIDYPEEWANDILPIAREAHQRLQFQGVHAQQQEDQTYAVGTAMEKAEPDKLSYHDWSAGIVRNELHKAGWRLADLLEKTVGANTAKEPSPASTPATSPTPPLATPSLTTSAAPQVATITKPITLQVPYGSIQLPVGMKLPYSSSIVGKVRVHYLGADYDVPIDSTDVPEK